MAEQEAPDYPFSLNLKKSGTHVSFASREEADMWIKEEMDAWNNVIGQIPTPNSQYVNQNFSIIKNTNIETFIQNTNNFENNYLSITAIRDFVTKCGISDWNIVGLTAAEIISRNSVSGQNAQGDAKMLSLIFRGVGDPAGWVDKIGLRLGEIERIRSEHGAALDRLNGLHQQAQKDWENEILGFRAKAALQAPKDYWDKRSENHQKEAQRSKRLWQRSIILMILLIISLPAFLFSSYGDTFLHTDIKDPSGLIERAAIIATVLGVIVWWSKQLLRDARSHEHLAEDASERVTMIETYASMVERGLQSSDLSIILTALYRTAATGLVEDGGPVLPIEVLMKTAGDIAGKK